MTFPFGRTVTVRSTTVAAEPDTYGNDVLTSTSVDVHGCVVWPRESSELAGGRDTVTSGLNVLAPPGTAVKATDQVTVDGVTYDVDGEPAVWGPSPFTGTQAGVLVTLTRVTG